MAATSSTGAVAALLVARAVADAVDVDGVVGVVDAAIALEVAATAEAPATDLRNFRRLDLRLISPPARRRNITG
jgi:hypothetical protein